MYEERLGGEFSTQHFQALKVKACAAGSGVSGVLKVWNATLIHCQEVRQRLEETQKKKAEDKNQIQQAAAANSQEEGEGMKKKEQGSEVGEDESSLTQLPAAPKEVVNSSESTTAANSNHNTKPDLKGEHGLSYATVENEKTTSVFSANIDSYPKTKWRLREHHSDGDLRSADSSGAGADFPLHTELSRSLSEGSCANSHLSNISGFSPLNIRHKHCQSWMQPLGQNLQSVENLPISHNESLRPENMSCKSRGDGNEEEGEGCTVSTKHLGTPETLLTPAENNSSNVL